MLWSFHLTRCSECQVRRRAALSGHASFQLFAQHDQLAQMVASVVAGKQDFAQKRLAIAPWDLRVEIGYGSSGEFLEGGKVFLNGLEGGIPLLWRRRRRGFRPIILWPFRCDIFGDSAKLQQVMQGDSDVLQELPCCVGCTFGFRPIESGREVFERRMKLNVCAPATQEFNQVVTKNTVISRHAALPICWDAPESWRLQGLRRVCPWFLVLLLHVCCFAKWPLRNDNKIC